MDSGAAGLGEAEGLLVWDRVGVWRRSVVGCALRVTAMRRLIIIERAVRILVMLL